MWRCPILSIFTHRNPVSSKWSITISPIEILYKFPFLSIPTPPLRKPWSWIIFIIILLFFLILFLHNILFSFACFWSSYGWDYTLLFFCNLCFSPNILFLSFTCALYGCSFSPSILFLSFTCALYGCSSLTVLLSVVLVWMLHGVLVHSPVYGLGQYSQCWLPGKFLSMTSGAHIGVSPVYPSV